jgi:lambda family phage portal protein
VKFWQRVAHERAYGKRSWFASVFSSTWSSLGSLMGTYDAVDPRNKAMRGVLARNASAGDLVTSLPFVRNLCRNYERNNTTVRAGTEAIVAITVGSGIALEPDTGDETLDAKLRPHWVEWLRDCGVNGQSMFQLQSSGMRDAVVAGELLWRFVIDHARIAQGKIPLAIMPLEPEWLGDFAYNQPTNNTGTIGGIDVDEFCRAVAYNLKNPNGNNEKVPADSIIHWFERRRSLQIRGEPWWAPVLTTLRQEKDLITAELEAAKNTASMSAAITTHGGMALQTDERGSPVRDIEMGSVFELAPGESITPLSHTRPSQQIAPFSDMLRGNIAATMRIPKRFLNRDITGANYSSQRGDNVDQERLSGPVREDFGNGTIGRAWHTVLPYLCVKAGIPYAKYHYRLVPDGQAYVDPLKDAQASAFAIAFGLSDYETEVGKRGGDYKAVWKKLAAQVKELEVLDLHLKDPTGAPALADPQELAQQEADAALATHGSDKPRDKDGHFKAAEISKRIEQGEDVTPEQFTILMRAIQGMQPAPAQPHQTINNIRMELPKEVIATMPAPVVNVMAAAPIVMPAPVVNIAAAGAPQVTVNVPEQAAPVVNIQAAAPVFIPAPVVNIDNTVEVPQRTIVARPQRDGSVLMVPQD